MCAGGTTTPIVMCLVVLFCVVTYYNYNMLEKTISYAESNQRLDKYVKKVLNDAPLSFVYKLFRKKDVKVNSKPAKIDYKIVTGDVVRIYVTDSQIEDFLNPITTQGRVLPFPIVYEDDNLLIINKPTNLLVHSDSSSLAKLTLTEHVLAYLIHTGEYNPRVTSGFIPGPAHRLDRNTTGIVMFGKNVQTLQELNELFKNKTDLDKFYIALVVGRIRKDGEINAKLLKDERTNITKVSTAQYAKTALTKYSVLKTFADTSLLKVQIITGRTHQIRVHMQSIDHPVVNDGKYGSFDFNREYIKKFKNEDIFLHAHSVIFNNVEGVLSYLNGTEFIAPLPENKRRILDQLKEE